MKIAPRVQPDPKAEADLHMYAGDLFGEFRLSSETGEQRGLFPLLFPGFAACVTAVVISVTATAMRTRLNMLGQIGFGGVAPVLAATLASLSVGLALTLLQMR